MKRSIKVFLALVLSALTLCAFGLSNRHPSTQHPRAHGYGLIVGDVRPCTAKMYDSSQGPLIVLLTKDAKTFETYNVSADPGTTWYHFDVPVGRYTLSTTWWGSKDYNVVVSFGKTSKVNFEVSCGPFIA
ncbi:MAG: hypothetical protein ABSE75_06235 [Acidimicrobiales bacterium]